MDWEDFYVTALQFQYKQKYTGQTEGSVGKGIPPFSNSVQESPWS